jgi:hypothetical protein
MSDKKVVCLQTWKEYKTIKRIKSTPKRTVAENVVIIQETLKNLDKVMKDD